jgi:hypothetical protein
MTSSSKVLKTSSFGACSFATTSPRQLAADTTTVNFVLSFEEALKLNLAVDECVHKLGRYNRATSVGKGAGLSIVIHLDKGRIRIQEGKV